MLATQRLLPDTQRPLCLLRCTSPPLPPFCSVGHAQCQYAAYYSYGYYFSSGQAVTGLIFTLLLLAGAVVFLVIGVRIRLRDVAGCCWPGQRLVDVG